MYLFFLIDYVGNTHISFAGSPGKNYDSWNIPIESHFFGNIEIQFSRVHRHIHFLYLRQAALHESEGFTTGSGVKYVGYPSVFITATAF